MYITGTGLVDGQELPVSERAGWVLNYSPEYDVNVNARDGELLLRDIATLTGGRSLAGDPTAVFAHTLNIANAATPVWPWLLVAAVVLLPFDIAVRRLVVTRSDLQRLRAWAFPKREGRQEASERMGSLMDAKARAQQRVEEQAEGVRQSTVSALRSRKEQSVESVAPPRATPAAPPVEIPVPTVQARPPETPSAPVKEAAPVERIPGLPLKPGDNVAGRLLQNRRKRDSDKPE
ncbi:MAG: hypothetical protein U0694_01665 [Anaerolineae bacterium]